MHADVPVARPDLGGAPWEALTHAVHRWFLPSAAVAALGFGGVLLSDPSAGVGRFAPYALLAIGAAALASTVAFWLWRTTIRSLPRPLEVPDPPIAAALSVPSPTPQPAVTGPRTRVASHAGSEWRVLSAPTKPGDEIWLSWLPRETRRLGAEVLGLASGGVFAASRPGSLVAVPVQGRAGTVDPAHSTGGAQLSGATVALHHSGTSDKGEEFPRPSLGPAQSGPSYRRSRPGPFTEEDLDRMFPPSSERRSVFLSDAPARVGIQPLSRSVGDSSFGPPAGRDLSLPADEPPLAEVDSEAGGDVIGSGVDDEITELSRLLKSAVPANPKRRDSPEGIDPAGGEIYLEATNPIPPHLRLIDSRSRSEGGRPGLGPGSRAESKSVCASCSKVVVNLRMSGPCPRCLRPICTDCLRESMAAHGQGRCIDCSVTPPVSAN